MKRVSKGFTLSEVLITLGIIGVVAAMTIPTLMTKINHIKLKSQFKEGYAILSQAVKLANDDGWSLSSAKNDSERYNLSKGFLKYFKGATVCNYGGNNPNLCIGREEDNNGTVSVTNKDYKYTNYAKNTEYIKTAMFDDLQFFLPNNMLIIVDSNDWKGTPITIDINGRGSKPNALGHDVFMFVLKESEKSGGYELVPMGTPETYLSKTNYCSKTSKDPRNGLACTYYAVQDETYFDKLP